MAQQTNTFDVISPVDGSVFATRSFASASHIEDTLASSQTAQAKWRTASIEERAMLCRGVVDWFVGRASEIGNELTWQMGRPIRYTPGEITGGFKERALYMIDAASDATADIVPPPKQGYDRRIRREPVGSVLVLAPWNYPFLTSVNVIIPAIMAGNSVILKHATQTPLCAERYSAAFEAVGAPNGLFQFLHASHSQIATVIGDARVDYVAFTGSVEGGKSVKGSIGQRFIGCGMELGGKDPAYVRNDADLAHTVENLVDGSFFNSGQSCCGIERIYVHRDVYDEFVSAFVTVTEAYQLGDPCDTQTTLGPMVRVGAAQHVRAQIADAIRDGATALVDTSRFARDEVGTPYVAPQVLVDVNHSMAIMSEETFGPAVGIMRVNDDDEAVAAMNDSKYGLTASIWSQDHENAADLANRLKAGTIYLNRCDYLDPELAWTGVKDSGFGCTLSRLGYESLTRPKSLHFKLLDKE